MQRPSLEPGFPDYASECRKVVEAEFEMLMGNVRSAGWDVKTALEAIRELADRYERDAAGRPASNPLPVEIRHEA
ncbi:hypothetical protein V6617_02060 [Pelagibacterium nitratireducens]|uniref:Uncharacterized protein n=1 Tax=Pelagibacterium nitratireducens TaxID=1046114 RepID=A0ABZ2I863_9HYPH